MNPGLDDELVSVVDWMVATSSSEVPLAAAAAKHPKPAVSVPRQAEGPQAWAGGHPAWASPPEGPSSSSLLVVLMQVLLLLLLMLLLLLLLMRLLLLQKLLLLQLLLLQAWAGGQPAGEASALTWGLAWAMLAWAGGQPAGEASALAQGLAWGVRLRRKHKKCSGSHSGTMPSCG